MPALLRLLLALLFWWPVGGSLRAGGPLVLGEETAAPTGASEEQAPADLDHLLDHRLYHYVPKRHVPPSLEPIVRHLTPGSDAFPEEKEAQELAERLRELSNLLRERPGRGREAVDLLLAPEFKGGRLTPVEEVSLGGSPHLEIFRPRSASEKDLLPRASGRLGAPAQAPPSSTMPPDLVRDRGSFGEELNAFVGEFQTVQVAEFLITAIAVDRDVDQDVDRDAERGVEQGLKHNEGPRVRTEVRYDLVGSGKKAWRAERVGCWRMEWRRGGDGAWRVVEWTALSHLRSRASHPVFTEVTEAALGRNPSFRRQLTPGLDYWLSTLDGVLMPGGMGHHGVSAGDADGDGLDDLYVAQPSGLPNRLFRNRGDGAFEDVTESAGLGVLDSTSQSLFADLDNDGDQDLVLVTRTGLLLFVNDGKGRFAHLPDAFRFKGTLRGSPTSVAMADYDRDGFLDIYLCTYSYFIGASEDKAGTPIPYHDAQNGPPNVLLRNDGRGRFTEVTDEVGLHENNDRFSFAAAWADYDEDGWPDLLVANDFGRKNLYHNEGMKNGQVRFKDVAARAGVEDYGAGMSAAWLDYDNDGRLDIYTGNMWTATGQRVTAEPGFMPDAPQEIRELYRRHARGNSLFRNRGDGTFEDVTLAAGAEVGRWAWSSDALDFDNDGWEDLYVVNGMFTRDAGEEDVDLDGFFWRQVTARSPLTARPGTSFDDAWRATNRLLAANGSQARHERNVFLRNNGKGGFDEIAGSLELDLDQDGRSFAVLDYDVDGDPDLLLMAARSSPQLRVFRNDFVERNASLALRLIGTRGNRDAVGARVTVETDQLRRTKIVQAGSGFISQHSKELLFGLGKSQRVPKVTIQWPSGLTQTLSDLPLRHRVWIEEGSDAVRTEPFRSGAASSPTPAEQAAEWVEPPSAGTWLYRPYPAPPFTLRDLEGQEHSLAGLRGRPALVLFWATSAPPSRLALEELARQRAALAGAGVEVLAVAVDAPESEPQVRATAKGLDVPVMVASDEVASTYSILSRYLFDRREDLRLPTVLLIDGQGDVVKVYRGKVAAAQILADVPKIDASPAERLARAVPFEGTFYSSPAERNYFQYSLDLAEQGFDAAALLGFERAAKLDPSAITFYNLGTALFQEGQDQEAYDLYEKALKLQPEFPEAFNNLGIFFGQQGDLDRAESFFKQAVKKRSGYGEAANNLALVLAAKGDAQGAITLLQRLLGENPGFEMAYVTLAKIYLDMGRRREGTQVLELLLQRNPKHPIGLQILRQLRGGG